MLELALNVLDIVQNSLRAGASLIEMSAEALEPDYTLLCLCVTDNGKGMDSRTLEKAQNPFFTSRTTRSVGLGIPFFKQAALQTGGDFSIESRPGEGTRVRAVFDTENIDCMPLGDMADTVGILIQTNPDIDFVYRVKRGAEEFVCDTRELKQILSEQPINNPAVIQWIKDYIDENQFEILKRRY